MVLGRNVGSLPFCTSPVIPHISHLYYGKENSKQATHYLVEFNPALSSPLFHSPYSSLNSHVIFPFFAQGRHHQLILALFPDELRCSLRIILNLVLLAMKSISWSWGKRWKPFVFYPWSVGSLESDVSTFSWTDYFPLTLTNFCYTHCLSVFTNWNNIIIISSTSSSIINWKPFLSFLNNEVLQLHLYLSFFSFV